MWRGQILRLGLWMSVGIWLFWFVLMVGEVFTSTPYRLDGGPIALRALGEEVFWTVIFTSATLLPLPAVGRLLYGLRFARWYRPVGALLVAAATAVAWTTGHWGGLLFCPALLVWTCSLLVRTDAPGNGRSDAVHSLRTCLAGVYVGPAVWRARCRRIGVLCLRQR